MKRAAHVSECGLYRYWLTRVWDDTLPILVWIMLNPSKADGSIDDQTVRKVVGFATRAGYGSVVILNLFAYRATKPVDLKAAGWPVGEANDMFINLFCTPGQSVVCAWGANVRNVASASERARMVVQKLRAWGCRLLMVGQTADGIPWHPLTFAYAHGLTPFPATAYS